MHPEAYSQWLPVSYYKWLTEEEIGNLDLESTPDSIGYLLSVDLSTPDNLHEELDCLPLAPRKRAMDIKEFSALQEKKIKDKPSFQMDMEEKLFMDFHPVTNYVVYHKTLLYYIQRGMVHKKVNDGIKFKQEKVFEGYTDYMTQLRHELTQKKEEV